MRARNSYLDNLKFVLIALVVFGHLIEGFINRDPLAMAVYRVVYLFHIPAFVFLAGFTAARSKSGWRGVGQLLFLLLVFEAIYAAPKFIFHHELAYQPWTPWKVLWFLLSLAFWRASGPWLARLKFPLLITTALALAAGCFSWIGYPLSLSRTFVFFPFFVLGYLHGPRVLAFARTLPCHPVRALGAVLIAGSVLFAPLTPQWLYGSCSYGNMPIPSALGLRIVQLIAALAATIAVFALIPRKECWMTRPGQHSLPTFLYHMLFVISTSFLGLPKLPAILAIPLCAIIALALAIGLSYVPLPPMALRLPGFLKHQREKPSPTNM